MHPIAITVGSIWRDNKTGTLVRVERIKNGKATLYDLTKKKKRQRPASLFWFNKTFNKGFLFVRDK